MHNLLKTVLGAAILAAAYSGTFGLPFGDAGMTAEELAGTFSAAGSGRPGPAGAGGPRAMAGSASVSLIPVVSASYQEVLTAIGTSRAGDSVAVTSEAAGQIVEATLVANAFVEQGDVLLRFASELEEIELRVAQVELESAQRTLDRYRSLASSGSGAVADTTVQEAETAMMLAETGVAMARYALDQLSVVAPISGRIGLSDARVGDRLAAGDPVVTIDDASRIVLSFNLPERAVDLLEVGREVQATTPALDGRSFSAVITAFGSRIDETTRTVTVEAEIDNSDGQLWPGMSFSVRLSNESAPLPQVPWTALNWTSEGAQVWAVRDGIATSVPVEVRMRQDDMAWIVGDLTIDDQVVLDGSTRIEEGAPIASESNDPSGEGRQPLIGAAESTSPAADRKALARVAS
ncbi:MULTISPECIES: efflux RND transporter periplasmic adaptor subunit [Roseobacteraceae]|uniref:Multidrug resistance protein MdtA n=1 Tax=Pseudosulfitobacter pseudonitzschiae TaxID=1402135 RepID=A0A221K7Q5_9RHOB|nr:MULTISPECIES: efflux RND transporter periplasmic adaptor subunit [Roseobacteraceae]ASM75005.1 multidrug resistance protein MdtA [Pseudosulfitobacter pseudonitzschiae]